MVYPIKICHIQNKAYQMEGYMEDLFKELCDYIEPFHAGWKKQKTMDGYVMMAVIMTGHCQSRGI